MKEEKHRTAGQWFLIFVAVISWIVLFSYGTFLSLSDFILQHQNKFYPLNFPEPFKGAPINQWVIFFSAMAFGLGFLFEFMIGNLLKKIAYKLTYLVLGIAMYFSLESAIKAHVVNGFPWDEIAIFSAFMLISFFISIFIFYLDLKISSRKN